MSDNPTPRPKGSGVRTILLVLMDVLIFLAICVTARVVVQFFGQLASQSWAETLLALTKPLVIPFGVSPIHTPYAGVFSVDGALTIVVYVVVDWVLSVVRDRA